ncbi:MAG TPA: FeoA family protein [Burkholderiaceae bacterium]|nr:FeoA family protein [Burkholderiaceae bacterium]
MLHGVLRPSVAAVGAAPAHAGVSLTLAQAPLRHRHMVVAVHAPASAPEWARWLEEIGFIPGEPVMLVARGAFGGDPLVVRVGQSTFALRRAEAACVQVEAVQ